MVAALLITAIAGKCLVSFKSVCMGSQRDF
jgi:hypothetical protein